ncbi:hypothetical protein CRG98_031785 [Punica granatum]|uniref:Uncharacterized protein n=1 Tax=Punica granatum TaxID=22663 RepID=A0A2I0IV10_PUNGR|nr:hypothetical protein CRG98_031785 [Punica granatum]
MVIPSCRSYMGHTFRVLVTYVGYVSPSSLPIRANGIFHGDCGAPLISRGGLLRWSPPPGLLFSKKIREGSRSRAQQSRAQRSRAQDGGRGRGVEVAGLRSWGRGCWAEVAGSSRGRSREAEPRSRSTSSEVKDRADVASSKTLRSERGLESSVAGSWSQGRGRRVEPGSRSSGTAKGFRTVDGGAVEASSD